MLNELCNNKLLDIFCNLVQIPSPSLMEQKVARWIKDFCVKNNLIFSLDSYENVHIKIPAKNKPYKPILLSAHMDVVGDNSAIKLIQDGDFIQTDGKRTLGADDKAGVACALMLASELVKSDIDHSGLEIVFTRDEEHGMSGIKHVDFSSLESEYVVVIDADKLGQLQVSGAGYTNAILKVKAKLGGHSGIDIQDQNRLNAARLISELVLSFPQGVFYSDETGTITSINLGTIIGGNIQNTASKVAESTVKSDNYLDYFIDNSVTNVINTDAQASFSIRSANKSKENELISILKSEVEKFNQKYKELASAEIIFSEHLPMFEKSNDDKIEKLFIKACEKVNVKPEVSSFHAGAETHVYAQKHNKHGKKFMPFLLGAADIFNMHSPSEKINYKTLLKGYEVIKQLFLELNNEKIC